MRMKNIERKINLCDMNEISLKKFIMMLFIIIMLSFQPIVPSVGSILSAKPAVVRLETQRRRRCARRFDNQYLLIVSL